MWPSPERHWVRSGRISLVPENPEATNKEMMAWRTTAVRKKRPLADSSWQPKKRGEWMAGLQTYHGRRTVLVTEGRALGTGVDV